MKNQNFEQQRVVQLDGGINFRDLGGYKNKAGKRVRWGKLFRSGHLANLSPSDITILKQKGITEVHDFRRDEEQSRAPSQPIEARTVNDYSMFIGSMSKFWDHLQSGKLNADTAHALVVESYSSCHKDVAPAYQRFFQSLINNPDNASLFHCAAGKDRTGIAAALILGALDIDRDIIIEDYLLTLKHFDSDNLISIVEGHLKDADVKHWEREWILPYCSVSEDNIHGFLDFIDQQYGDINNYLTRELDLSLNELDKFKSIYLE
jgi:protein-tyrosine phosphatase